MNHVYTRVKELNSSIKDGLSEKEAETRLKEYGKNIIDNKVKHCKIFDFLAQFKDPMIIILIIAGGVSLALGEWIDASIILIVVILNAIIGFAQEVKAHKALESLKDLSSPKSFVKREGKIKEILSEDVVPGDILILNEGDIVSSDALLIKEKHLKINESSLTGESFPVNKSLVPDEESMHRADMVYASTEVLEGSGEALCLKTGVNTEIGRIASLTSFKKEKTPLEERLNKLGKFLGILTILICLVLFLISLLRGGEVLEMLITSISLGVAAIPEGLPAVVTIVLSLGVQKMVKINTIVRKLPSVETLGSVTVVCTDKTGTLTQNKMKVEKAFFQKTVTSFEDYKKEISLFVLCTNASSYKGDPTEKAIIDLGLSLDLKRDELEKLCARIDEVPFSSNTKKMETIHLYKGKRIKIIKGAPEIILKSCQYINIDNPISLNVAKKKEIEQAGKEMSSRALRTIAGAVEIDNKTIFIGILGMKDPLRKEAKESVAKMKEGGVKVKMITGDHKETAFAIAREIDLASSYDEVMEGKEIDEMEEKEFLKRIKSVSVFARVTPSHKMKIVKGYKTLNEVVAMTGDGVNDAPSLKAADVGIAMGQSGTEVAKEASDMVLREDNFLTITKAMEEGRNIYSNIRKSVLFLLSSNFAEVLVMFISLLFNLPLPLLAIHILFVNLISDSFPALVLGTDKIEDDLMKQRPRSRDDSLFSQGGFKILVIYSLIIFFLTSVGFIIPTLTYILDSGIKINSFSTLLNNIQSALGNEDILIKSRTIAFSILSLSELFHMIGMSSPHRSLYHIIKKKNVFLLLTFVFGLLLQIALTEIPLLSEIFKMASLSLREWVFIILLSSFPLIVHEIIKKDVY